MVELSDTTAAAIAERFKALGEPMRLRLLQALRAGECSVGDLAEITGGGQANVSKHLQVLHGVGLVTQRREGRHVMYRTNAETVRTIHEWSRLFARHWRGQLRRIKDHAEEER